jgi:hypothetical protein
MSAYITTLKLMDNAVAHEASEEAVWQEYAEGASRLFDKLCDVEDNFFAKTTDTQSAKTFYGNGVDMMQLPPFVVGTVTSITIDGTAFAVTDWRVSPNGFLIRLDDGEFDETEAIVVTAKWGFAEIPADVRLVVQELANYLWRVKDPLFTKMSGVEIPEELSPTVKAAIKKYRDKFSTSAY